VRASKRPNRRVNLDYPLNSIELSTHVTTSTISKTEIANGLGAIADEVGTVIASPVGDALGLMS